MQLSNKELKKIKRKLRLKKRSSSKLDKLVHKIPYKQASIKKIENNGAKIIKPACHHLMKEQNIYEKALNYEKRSNIDSDNQSISKSVSDKYKDVLTKYESTDSRTLSFGSLKRDKQNAVTLCGFVGGYKLAFNHFYHQVAIYVLLRYVSGITYNHKFKYLTNHLWIDTNLANRLLFYDTVVGIGDCVIVRGRPNKYNGHIGNLRGVKISLDDAVIVSSGYPIIRHNHFTHRIIPYNHGSNYLYYANAKLSPNIMLGNEISLFDRNHVHGDKYYIGYSNAYDLGVIIHKGLKFKAYKHNPRLVVTFHNYNKKIIRNVRWTTNTYSIKHGTVLTSAKNYQHHPKRTERNIDSRLRKTLQISYRYIIQSAMKNE